MVDDIEINPPTGDDPELDRDVKSDAVPVRSDDPPPVEDDPSVDHEPVTED